jgi:hypothetical protein
MIQMRDARQSAQRVESMWHCHKLRLANGHALVVTREWWDYFLRALDPQNAAIEAEKEKREYLGACERAGVQ